MYIITKNNKITLVGYKTKELGEEFIKQYEKEINNKIYKLEREINNIFDEYDLNYSSYIHREIYKHLCETGFIGDEEIDDYVRLENEIENIKNSKIKLGIIEQN